MAAATKIDTWKKAKRHEITLPSGTKVQIELPNLPMLIKTGQIANSLIDAAVGAQQGNSKVDQELISEQAEFYNKLVALTVKEPEITEQDVPDLPYEDVEMVVEFATRQRDLDALGHHLGGLEKQADFRRFRGLDGGDPHPSSL